MTVYTTAVESSTNANAAPAETVGGAETVSNRRLLGAAARHKVLPSLVSHSPERRVNRGVP